MKLYRKFAAIIFILLMLSFSCQASYNDSSQEDNNASQIFVEKIEDGISNIEELKDLYYKFAEKDISIFERQKIVEEFLYKFTNAENIKEDTRGEYVNAKHLAVVEFYMGKEFVSTSPDKISQKNPRNPNIVAGARLESIYEQIKAMVYSEFASELLIKDLIKISDVYLNVETEKLEWFFDQVITKLDEEMKRNPEAAKERIYNFGAWAIGLGYFNQKSFFDPFDDDCFYTHFTENDRELKWKFDSIGKIPYDLASNDPAKQGDEAVRVTPDTALIDFHARRGDDVVYGGNMNDRFIGGTGDDILDGGNGNDEIYAWEGNDIIWGGNGDDVIYGGAGDDIIFAGDGDDIIFPDHKDNTHKSAEDGNDIVNAGKGNDRIYSLYGNDTYIFNIGDGNDIIEDKHGEDTIYFGDDIDISDIKAVKIKNDLVLKLEEDESSITIKNYYKKHILRKNENLYKIEYIQFYDTKKIPFSEVFLD